MLHSETLWKKGRREEEGEDGTSRNKNPKSPPHTQVREQVFGKKDTGPQPRTEQPAVRGGELGVGDLTSLSPAAAHRPLSAGSPVAAAPPGVLARCAPTHGPAPG